MKVSKLLENIEVKPRAYLLLGPPKSGKSTWAQEKIKRNIGILNLNIENFSDIEIRSDIFEDCLKKKQSFIYEGFALKDYRIEKLINKIIDNNYRVILVHFNKKLNEEENSNFRKIRKKIKLIYDEFKDKVDEIIEVDNVRN